MLPRLSKPDLQKTCFISALALYSAGLCAQGVEPEESSPNAVEETLVLGSRESDYSIITEDAQKLVETAGAAGDPLAAIFALPGVVYTDGQEPSVRGSSPEDNQFVVDFMPASYIFHDFGVSIFSEFILHDFQMYSAGFGPEYSNATGAVFNVRLRDPAVTDLHAIADISMLRSGIFVESGLGDNAAFYLSARRSLLDLFLDGEDISDEEEGINFKSVPRDSDFQFKYIYHLNDNQRLSLSANGARDEAEAELTEAADFVASNPDFAGDAALVTSYQGGNILWEYDENGYIAKIGIGKLLDESRLNWGDDYFNDVDEDRTTVKGLFRQPLGSQFALSVGTELSQSDFRYEIDTYIFQCTEFDPDCDLKRTERINEVIDLDVNSQSYYTDVHWTPNDFFALNVGLQRQYNDYTEETFHHPRIAARWQLNDSFALTSKAGSYNRFPELETILPETGNPNLQSPEAMHYTLGMEKQMDSGWSISAEVYSKTLENLPRAIDNDLEDSDLRYVNETEGKAYGIDVMINKNRTDRWWGWLALSASKSDRTNLLTGETREYFLDTPLIANWVMNYQFRPNLNIGWRWSIRSGQATTPIIGIQENPWFEDSVLPVYGEPFSERLPTYQRLDVRLQWDTRSFGKEASLIVDLINLTNSKNVSERQLDYDKVDSIDDEVETVDTEDFGFQPAITYRIYF